MIVSAKALKFGDNIDTDVMLPAKYMTILDPVELASHAMEGLDSSFPAKAKNGVILVAGRNFGCGSSREQAPLALKYAGVKCVLAESFSRIFYRNAINIGLPAVECAGVSVGVEEGDDLTVNLKTGVVENRSKKSYLCAAKLPPFILTILHHGGLIETLKARMNKNELL